MANRLTPPSVRPRALSRRRRSVVPRTTLTDDPFGHLDDHVRRYLTEGTANGETDRHNRRALDALRVVPRVLELAAAPVVSTAAHLLGRPVAAPLAIAPMAAQRLAHPDGELAVARAAARVGVPMVLSLSSTTPVETICDVAGLEVWFQVYPFADAGETDAVISRAIAAGASAVVLTVDLPPTGQTVAIGRAIELPPGAGYAHHGPAPAMATAFGWGDLARLIAAAEVPVLVKGITHPLDADRAVAAGAAGVIVSNHGGRVLDGLIAAIDALDDLDRHWRTPGTVACPRLVDGSIRTGVDVIRALALGAEGVLVGRTVLQALARGGEEAVFDRLSALVADVHHTLAVLGARSPAAVEREHVRWGSAGRR
ncbi:alpha-hydroxy acid oxidase [Desertimonas flava]|uniref:alpha-hydroxy acid oxidase n=1 Tax=Desertimonas flava TaxID=2064846 RepID=UPI0013C4C377|nr:alpha-hydroxy acid oxidase [Desertimonas flava]